MRSDCIVIRNPLFGQHLSFVHSYLRNIAITRYKIKNIQDETYDRELRNHYVKYDMECDANSYKVLDIDKIADVIAYFARYAGDTLYKVKLMKMQQ